jgi:hypothetical protein
VLERDLHAASGRSQVWQRGIAARDGLLMRGTHLLKVVDEDELGEVVAQRGARERLARGQQMAAGLRPLGDLGVHCAARGPCSAPLVPLLDPPDHILEVREWDALRHEAVRPVRQRRLDTCVLGHECPPREITSTRLRPQSFARNLVEGAPEGVSSTGIGGCKRWPSRYRPGAPDRRL